MQFVCQAQHCSHISADYLHTQFRGSVVLEDGKILFLFRSGFRWRHVNVLPGDNVANR